MQGPQLGGRALLLFDPFPGFDLSPGFLITVTKRMKRRQRCKNRSEKNDRNKRQIIKIQYMSN
jgi:hypothetical protein